MDEEYVESLHIISFKSMGIYNYLKKKSEKKNEIAFQSIRIEKY